MIVSQACSDVGCQVASFGRMRAEDEFNDAIPKSFQKREEVRLGSYGSSGGVVAVFGVCVETCSGGGGD